MTIQVKQDDAAPVPVEVLAAEIASIAGGIRKLRAGRLNDRALVLLIQNAAPMAGVRHKAKPVSASTVRAVLAGIENLEREYLKPRKPDVK